MLRLSTPDRPTSSLKPSSGDDARPPTSSTAAHRTASSASSSGSYEEIDSASITPPERSKSAAPLSKRIVERRYYPSPPSSLRSIFLFVNPTSGGNAAASFTSAGLAHAMLKEPNVEFYIADIREGASGLKPCFLQLKETLEMQLDPREKIYVVMAGGDGTVLWGISEIWEHHIDDARLAFGVIPYGTGNDFARALEWSQFNALNPFAEDMKALRNLCHEWLNSPIVLHDLWDIDIFVKPTGSFKKIDSKTREKKVLTDASGNPERVLRKKICNYFSLGIESRIGIGFDRHRTTNAVRNKMVYMGEGVKKQFFHHNIAVPKLLRKMVTYDEGDSNPMVIFDNDDSKGRRLHRCASLIASNIPSFASGLDLWRYARRLGLKGDGVKQAPDIRDLMSAPQYMGDGKIEWVSFSGVTSLGTEQLIEGLGKRVHQGKGPFELDFYDLDPDRRVYFQIDGEFYQMQQPVKIQIRHLKKISCLANRSATKSCFKTDSL